MHLWPNQLPFIDSMADTTGDVTMQYETVITLRAGWQEILDNYNITWVIIPTHSPLAITLLENQGWEMIYEDSTAIIIRRSQ